MKIGHFSKLMKLNIHLLLCSKRHYIDEIEYPPSPICGEKPQFESNVTSFQFRQNASARWWPIGHHLASAFWRGIIANQVPEIQGSFGVTHLAPYQDLFADFFHHFLKNP